MGASPCLASPGSCPSDATVRNVVTGVPQALSTIGITGCYYVSASGLNVNTGTSESAPLLLAPGMPNCNQNCSTIAAGSLAGIAFIFKVADCWHFGNPSGSAVAGTTCGAGPYTGGVWNITKGGSSATVQTFYGSSPTWTSNAALNRPIMSADNPPNASTTLTSCGFFIGGNVNNNNFTSIGSVYTSIRGFEWTGMCQGDIAVVPTGGGCASQVAGTDNHVFTYGSDFTAEDNYFHGFSHIKFGSPTQPENCIVGTVVFNSHIFRNGAGENILYNVMDNSDSDPLAQGWGFYSGYNVAWNYIGTESFGGEMSFSGMCTYHDNTMSVMNDQGHSDWLQVLSEACNPGTVYNNVFEHYGTNKSQGAFWLFGGVTNYAFNNLWFDVAGPIQFISIGGTPKFPGNAPYIFFNNTWQANDSSGITITTCVDTVTVPGSVLSNNHTIYPVTGAPYSTVTNSTTIPCTTMQSNGLLTIKPSELTMNNTTAKSSYSYGSLNYSAQAYPYSPTSATSPTVGGGDNNSAYCTTMAGSSNPLTAAAGNACLSDTTFGVSYNSTTHTISGPGRTVNARPASGAWDRGAYQYQAGVSNPLLSASPTSLAFGTLTESGACPGVGCASLSTTITNVGTANATSITASISPSNSDYTITVSPASSLTPNSNTTVTVKCAPTISGAESATNLSITSNAPTVSIPLTCSGSTAAAVTPSPATLAFGNQQTSTTSTTLTDTVTSSGGSNFVFNSTPYTLGGSNPGDFSIITPGSVTWTTIQKANNFTCASGTVSPATFTCTASFASNITAGHTLVALASIWNIKTAGSTISVPTHNATTGDSDTWTHCASGAGTNIFSTSNTYSVTDCDYVISATGGSKSVTISWTPHSYTTGIIQEDLDIYELSASSGTVAVDTQGSQTNTNCTTCTGPALTLSGASDAVFQWSSNPDNTFTSISGGSYTCDNDNSTANVYGAFCLGLNQASAPAQTWTYGGASHVAMSALAFTSTVNTGSACVGSLTVMPNGTCTIQATFTPTTTGSRSATLTLNGNASGSISLTGTGTSSTPVVTPTLSPVPATYTSTQTVTITSATSGATICYRTDGGTPSAATPGTCDGSSTSLTNGGTVSVSVTETLLALGTKAALTNSGVAGGLYTITTTPTLAAPTFSVAGGSALSFSPVTINLPSGSTGCYTTDGSTPAASSPGTCSHGTTYSTPITVTQNTQLQALATEAANNNSSITSATYNVILPTPTFTPNTQFGPNGQIIMITVQSGATLCVTTNGTTPASNGSGSGTCSVGQQLSNGATLTVTQPTVIQAIGTQSNYVDSAIGTAVIVSPASAPAVILML